MTNVKRVSPREAQELMAQGYVYVDVRSVQEFEAGHPEGAFNIPLLDMGPFGMTPNPHFIEEMAAHFAKDAKIIVGCKAGGRSLQAAHLMAQAGFEPPIDQRAGQDGNGFEPGWRASGLPVACAAAPGRSYAELKGGAAAKMRAGSASENK